MLSYLLLLAVTILSPLTSASTTGQFRLNIEKDASRCWLQCHTMTINAVHSVENDPLGNYEAIGNNCKDEPYITNIPACLVSTCVSAPDVAYAFEFGKRWCAKAGVDVSETLKMPETYALAAKEYFQSDAYINGASSLLSTPSITFLSTGLVAVCALSLLV